MDFKTTFINRRRPRRSSGFTLLEVLIASGIGVLCMAALAALFLFSMRSFKSLANYEELHSDDRVAMDSLTRDIRRANRVTSYTTNSLTLEDFDGVSLVYTYSPGARTFTRTKNGSSKTLLRECERLSFRLGERNPVGGTYNIYPAATVNTAKVIDVSWLCSRKIRGITANTESVQTARIVIRKQGV